MEGSDSEGDALVKPTISLWSSLKEDEKEKLIIEMMACFPQVFGRSNLKYQKIALWCVVLFSRKKPDNLIFS